MENKRKEDAAKLRAKLFAVDDGRFSKVLSAIPIKIICWECYYLMPTITDPGQSYRCRCIPECMAATLHPNLLSYLMWKIGIIKEGDRKTYEEQLLNG